VKPRIGKPNIIVEDRRTKTGEHRQKNGSYRAGAQGKFSIGKRAPNARRDEPARGARSLYG
jgi:hypothetical protein